jgi:hypothetical protein
MKAVSSTTSEQRLLAVAAAGLLAAAGLVVVHYAQPAEANYPGKPAKIAYAGYEGNDSEIYTINADGEARNNSPITPRATASLPTRLQVSA